MAPTWQCYGCGHQMASLAKGWDTQCPECGSYEIHLNEDARRHSPNNPYPIGGH